MYLEEQIADLYAKVAEMGQRVDSLQREERWVSVKELAQIMNVAPNTIYIKVRNGDIYASRKFGAPRIPLSQFYKDVAVGDNIKKLDERSSLKERIFAE